jgi:hypothetical protein
LGSIAAAEEIAMPIINFRNRSTSGFDEDALVTTVAGERIFNFGHLTTIGDLADGIYGQASNVSMRNFARIETSGAGADGVHVDGEHARIENYALVTTQGPRSAEVRTPNPVWIGDGADGLLAVGDQFRVVNYGTVRALNDSAALIGIGADGIAVNYGCVEVGVEGVTHYEGVAAYGERSQAINRGQITGDGNGTGMSVLGTDASAYNSGSIRLDAGQGMVGWIGETNLTNTGVIRISGVGVGVQGVGNDHQLNNFGLIEMRGDFSSGMETSMGFFPFGSDNEILNAGRIVTRGEASEGVVLAGFGQINGSVINRGVIDTEGNGAAGVLMVGDGVHLANSGRIITDGGLSSVPAGPLSAAGVLVSGDDAVVENTRSGTIMSENGGSPAVELNLHVLQSYKGIPGPPTSTMSAHLENSGLIQGASVAILGGDGQETVLNRGRIVGDVDLGDGADTFVFATGGAVHGTVVLGGGDDIARIENGSGRTVIADFAAGAASEDVVDISAFFASFDEVQTHSRQRGSDVVITLDHNDTLILEDVQLSALNVDDFLLV